MKPQKNTLETIGKILLFMALLYVFFLTISMIGHSFKGMGKDQVSGILSGATHNPFAGLLIGVLCTAIIQSSSTTTSIVVGFVSGGVLSLGHAIPIIMGSNIGTTITNSIVSFTHVRSKQVFHKAYSVGIVHDIFNILCVMVFLPLELSTHYLEKSALYLTELFVGSSSVHFDSPIKVIVKPVLNVIDSILNSFLSPMVASVAMLVLALILLVTVLVFIVRIMKSLTSDSIEQVFDVVIAKHGALAILLGACITALIQSSSMTTALLVTFAGAGLITLEGAFPVTLGANLGTTVTAFLASMAGSPAGLSVALTHLLFNMSGILVFYVIKPLRQIPLGIARYFSTMLQKRWYFAIIYVVVVFFVLPVLGMILFE